MDISTELQASRFQAIIDMELSHKEKDILNSRSCLVLVDAEFLKAFSADLTDLLLESIHGV